MLTRPGWAVVGGAVASAAAGRLFGVTELFVLAGVAAALVVAALVWVRRPIARVAVERRVRPPRLVAGGLGRVEVRVTNPTRRRVPTLFLVDPVEGTVGARLAVGPLRAGARQDLGYRLPPLQRGQLHIGPLTTEVIDPFGLARRRLPGTSEAVVTVLPAVDPAPSLPRGGGRHEPLAGLSRRSASTRGAEDLVTLRPYVVGDDLRRVHWPSTAHADDLQVRRDEERWQGHLAVLLDTRADALDPLAFEQAVSAAAGIVDAVAEAGDRVRLLTSTGTDSGMVDALRARYGLLEDLALVEQDRHHPVELPAGAGRAPTGLVVLTGPDGGELAESVRDLGFGPTIVVSFPGRRSGDGTADVTVAPGEPLAAAWSGVRVAEVAR